ncbi:Putative uroporphyrinogen-III C-methyltransferase [Thalassocella blandensis]|nr:Putative uroporphyrinogen-III C-methyltransferase [Thalassocella blandensis]
MTDKTQNNEDDKQKSDTGVEEGLAKQESESPSSTASSVTNKTPAEVDGDADEKTDKHAAQETDEPVVAESSERDNASVDQSERVSAADVPRTTKTSTVTPDEKKPKVKKAADAQPVKTSRLTLWFVVFMFIVLCLAIAAGAYLMRYGKDLMAQQRGQISELQQQLGAAETRSAAALRQAKTEQAAAIQGLQQANNELKQIISDLDQRLVAQNKRLRSMSTTSREDWLLAEAEYLLKLANQRVLIEKNAEGAAALLAEADAILRDLSDPDLFSIRREVKKDLAALRLTEKIDVEGIYLSLVAMAGQVESLPVNPTMQQQIESMQLSNDDRVKELSKLDDVPWYKKIGRGLSDFGEKLKSFFQVYSFDQKPTPLLPPNEAGFLQQNLRMMIERAQLALLREQQDVYRQSLEQTKDWIKTYFPNSKKAQNFVKQIESIEQENIVRSMPDISASLELLQGYIIDLHRVGDAKPDARGQ